MRLEASGRTDTGPVRDNNEDNFLVDMDGGLFVVADGMGGHAAGEIASAIAVETVGEVLLKEVDPDETRISMDVSSHEGRIRERLRYTMNQASLRIRKEAMADPSQMGMGTTLVALLIEDGMAHLGHVGDSRASTASSRCSPKITPWSSKKSTPVGSPLSWPASCPTKTS